jgi:hypothetical protein
MPHPNSTTRRHCHYCGQPATTAFYLPVYKAWACPTCYFERAKPNTVVMATEGTIEACTKLLLVGAA